MEVVEEVKICSLSTLILRSREQLYQEQKEDSVFCCLYRYLDDPDGIRSLNTAIVEKWSLLFKLIDDLLFFYSKAVISRSKLNFSILANLCKAILKKFHDNPLAGYLGIRKTYSQIYDLCYFPKLREIVREYVYSRSTR